MEYTTLGETGMMVSQICLGCMSFGSGREWMLDRDESEELIERALELGVNFFDTANIYSNGESEEILGDILAEYDRDEQVVATKVWGQMREEDPNSQGLSRKTILAHTSSSAQRRAARLIRISRICPTSRVAAK